MVKKRWNLDSELRHPQLIVPELLAFFLDAKRASGYTVHVVRGSPLPPQRLSSRQSLSARRDDEVWHPCPSLMLLIPLVPLVPLILGLPSCASRCGTWLMTLPTKADCQLPQLQ